MQDPITKSELLAESSETTTLNRDGPYQPPNLLAGRFALLHEIGNGGMGTVYAARDTHMQGQPVIAIKLLNAEFRKNLDAVTALERECRRVRVLAHENIVRVFEFYRTPEHVFITMELLEGETFDQVIKRFPGGMPFEDARPLIRAAGAALAYSHRQSPPFIHYDFKPRNVLLTKQKQVKVLDFGVGRAVHTTGAADTSTTLYDTVLTGLTPAYASPEMLAGLDPDPRDDVYSLSCFAYELLSGSHPFNRVRADLASKVGSPPARLPNLEAACNRALAAGLAFDRDARTASIDQFIKDLDGFGETVVRPTKPKRVALWATVLLIVLATGVFVSVGRLASPPAREQPMAAEVRGSKIADLYKFLGINASPDPQKSYPIGEVARTVRTAPRHVSLGSSPEQIRSAFEICKSFATECSLGMYSDEQTREATLAPFQLDTKPVSVAEFRNFVLATGYRTEAEQNGSAFAWVGSRLHGFSGGNWRNGVSANPAPDGSAVVGVTIEDVRNYCAWKQERLPTEDEWEYVAQGPERKVFPSGDDISVAVGRPSERPGVDQGPPGGINNRYFGLSGNVWQWVDTSIDGNYLLKGGSWLETNPANKRSAARRREEPHRADSDSGFRCAKSVLVWPDEKFWLRRVL